MPTPRCLFLKLPAPGCLDCALRPTGCSCAGSRRRFTNRGRILFSSTPRTAVQKPRSHAPAFIIRSRFGVHARQRGYAVREGRQEGSTRLGLLFLVLVLCQGYAWPCGAPVCRICACSPRSALVAFARRILCDPPARGARGGESDAAGFAARDKATRIADAARRAPCRVSCSATLLSLLGCRARGHNLLTGASAVRTSAG